MPKNHEYNRKPPFFERFNNWVKSSVMLKIITIGILILLLIIPASMLENLVNERQSARDLAAVSTKFFQETEGGIIENSRREISFF